MYVKNVTFHPDWYPGREHFPFTLDEPETALSPRTQIEVLDLPGRMSAASHVQFVIATHLPILLSCPGATIYSFDQVPIAPIPYEQTDHYKRYKAFLTDRHRFLTSR
jgi:predicted ATPase